MVPDETTLLGHLDASPTPHHAVARAAEVLTSAGWAEVDEAEPWTDVPDRWFVRRAGALVAADWPSSLPPETPLRIVGAPTDSPNLRLKPHPTSSSAATPTSPSPAGC